MNAIKTATATKITFRKMGADYGDNPSVLAAIDAVVTALDGLSDAVVMSEIEA
ncbi:hypothetical protein [uncultured Actinomyces sp.]|uniref:hypothetical protein n=1 Tax=uncultured Actinomyces sp. TaxID=249061 RepID=UPI00260689B4|nr:hypothetical protein [uncultured Actinomyces sp.]